MAVTLVNPSNQPFTVTLYHDVFCAAANHCVCARERVVRPVRKIDGTFGQRPEMRLIPVSLTIDGGGRRIGLHDAILKVPQVHTALAARPPALRALVIDGAPTFPPGIVAPSPTQTQPLGKNVAVADKTRSRTQSRQGRGES